MIPRMTTFATSAWAEQFSTRLQDSARVRTESMSWVFGPLLLVVDADAELGVEATAIRVDLHEGSVRGVSAGPAGEAGLAPFRIEGSVQRWQAVFGGTLGLVDAVLDSRLRATGDLPTLARHRELFAAVAAAGAEVETTWPEPATA